MEIKDVKKYLNETVRYGTGLYKFEECVIRKDRGAYLYSAVLVDTKNRNSRVRCKLESVEVLE